MRASFENLKQKKYKLERATFLMTKSQINNKKIGSIVPYKRENIIKFKLFFMI